MLTSIIILNWNGIAYTRQCIESLHKNTKLPFEIIVVDNGSNEDDKKELRMLLRKKDIDVLIENETNRGFSAANNQGLRKAKGDYLMLLNNDTLATENWLRGLIEVAESDSSIGIVGPHLPESETSKTVYGGGYITLGGVAKHSFNADEGAVEQVGGAALFFKRKVFEKIGGLDEGFSPIYFEESDYCARARKAGFKVVFTPRSTIIHFGSKITKKQPSRWMYVVLNKNRIRYMLLHFSLLKLLLSIPFEIARVIKGILTLKAHWLLEAYWIDLRNIGEILGKRLRYVKGDLVVGN